MRPSGVVHVWAQLKRRGVARAVEISYVIDDQVRHGFGAISAPGVKAMDHRFRPCGGRVVVRRQLKHDALIR